MGDELGRRNNEYLQKQILAFDSKLVFLVHAKNILYEQSLPPADCIDKIYNNQIGESINAQKQES